MKDLIKEATVSNGRKQTIPEILGMDRPIRDRLTRLAVEYYTRANDFMVLGMNESKNDDTIKFFKIPVMDFEGMHKLLNVKLNREKTHLVVNFKANDRWYGWASNYKIIKEMSIELLEKRVARPIDKGGSHNVNKGEEAETCFTKKPSDRSTSPTDFTYYGKKVQLKTSTRFADNKGNQSASQCDFSQIPLEIKGYKLALEIEELYFCEQMIKVNVNNYSAYTITEDINDFYNSLIYYR